MSDEPLSTDEAEAAPDAGAAAAPDEGAASPDRGLEVIRHIPVRLSLEVGHAEINIAKLMRLTRGSVVELDREAGEPLDVLVNGKLVARGEVVVVNDKFGVRLTDVISAEERAESLR